MVAVVAVQGNVYWLKIMQLLLALECLTRLALGELLALVMLEQQLLGHCKRTVEI
jgi:hypothetical protein